MSECKPGVYTSYKPHLQRDKTLLKLIAKGTQTHRPNQVQSALIRRHFLELTQSFIIPLERYIVRLMPLQKSISPYKVRTVIQHLFRRSIVNWNCLIIMCCYYYYYWSFERRFRVLVRSKRKIFWPAWSTAGRSWPQVSKVTGRDSISVSWPLPILNRGPNRGTKRPTGNYVLFKWKPSVNR